MATDKQREANRINARKSTGPRTTEGKAATRMNALTHGMRARTFEVLPNEDPAQFQARIDAWFDDYQPDNTVEDQLVRHAAILSWKIDRMDRHQNAIVSRWVRDAVAQAKKDRADRIFEAARQLLPSSRDVEQSGDEGDPASTLLEILQGSAEGCRWLIERWQRLRDSVQGDEFWIPEFEMHAVRLSGIGSGPLRDPEVVDMIVANRVLMSPENFVDPFRRLDGPLGMAIDRSASQDSCLRQPKDAAEAKAVLSAFADRAIARLQTLLESRELDGDLDAKEVDASGWIAAFDSNPEGERVRRYQASMQRELLRTLDVLEKMQRNRAKASSHSEKGDSQETTLEPVPVSASNEASSPVKVADSPQETPFEEFLSPPVRANEAKLPPHLQVLSANNAKRAVATKPEFLLNDTEEAGWLGISCEKG